MRHLGVVNFVMCISVAACSRPASSPPAPPAAKVTAAVPESALATLTLTEDAQRRLAIEIAPVERRTISRSRTLGADVVPEGGALTTVTAPFSGTIGNDAPVPRVGAELSAEQTVLTLIPFAPAERDVRIEAERMLTEAEGRQDMMRKRVERAAQLVQDGSGSRRAVEEAEADVVVADAAVRAARERLALAAKGVTVSGAVILRSPHAALLRTLQVAPGQAVAAGAPLFDLVRLDAVWLRVPVYAGDLDTLDTRAAVDVVPLGAAPGTRGMPAAPVTAPPAADPITAGVDLFYRVSNSHRALRPGQRVSVRIPLRGQDEQIVIPRAAVLFDATGGAWTYEARTAGRFVRQRVELIDVVNDVAVLSRGPAIGTRVVTTGAAELFGTEFGVGK